MTFNDEVACQIETGLSIEGAVQSAALLDILQKLDDESLEVRENEDGAFEFRGKRKGFAVTRDEQIFLPIDNVETPTKWRKLPPEFTEAIALTNLCVSGDDSQFVFTCIHLHPEYIEACDNFQLLRFKMKFGLKNPVLVRGTSLKDIAALPVPMDEVALTKSWMHFRNAKGLQYSCRRYAEDYPDLNRLLESDGHAMVLPRGAAKASERAAIFATDGAVASQIQVKLAEGKMRIKGEGTLGWYKEVSKVVYDGPPLMFWISPSLLTQISEKHQEAEISEDKLVVSGGKWTYVTVLSAEEAKAAPEPEESEEKPKQKRSKE